MAELSYAVAPEIFGAFPGYRLGVAVFDAVDNSGRPQALSGLLRAAEEHARTAVSGNVAEHPCVAPWRDAYRRFGAKPSEHRSSIEALLRRVLKPDELPLINPLVDVGNIVSLRHLLPAGVHPVRHADARIALRLARDGDLFLADDAKPAEAVPAGEVVLADAAEVLTRRWTWRQAVSTRTLATSRQVFFNVDGLADAAERVEEALNDTQELVSRFCGGRCVFAGVLTREAPAFSVQLT